MKAWEDHKFFGHYMYKGAAGVIVYVEYATNGTRLVFFNNIVGGACNESREVISYTKNTFLLTPGNVQTAFYYLKDLERREVITPL